MNLFLVDWDGCVNGEGGPGKSWDLEGVIELRQVLQEVKRKAPHWGVAVMTGRSDDYGLGALEALGLIELYPEAFSGFENGGLYRRHKDWELFCHPLITDDVMKAFEIFDKYAYPRLSKISERWEYKRVCRTMAVPGEKEVEEFFKDALEIVRDVGVEIDYNFLEDLDITHGGSAVDFIAKNLGKGAGLEFVVELMKMDVANTIAIGDSISDLDMFKVAPRSGAPANASDKVKEKANVVAKKRGPQGVAQIIRYYVFGDESSVIVRE